MHGKATGPRSGGENGSGKRVDAIVVGAGFAGMYMLHRLRGLGLRVRVFEAGSDVGGTWYWNRYPGARCDVESMQYSYSFSEELQQEWHWSELFATQPEILAYAKHVAKRFDLLRDITFGARVQSAHFDEATSLWTVSTDTGERVTSRFCVMATGLLSSVHPPEIPGFENFHGPWFHTGAWPHQEVDLSGKTIGVIGTGSSGIQAIPVLAEQAEKLYVFQRTPNYVLPSANRPMPDDYELVWKLNYKAIRSVAARTRTGVLHHFGKRSALEVQEADREAEYERRWRIGSSILAAYNDTYSNAAANETAGDFLRRKIGQIVMDPRTAEALTPRSYPIGAKRVCIDSRYYDTFNRQNVELVSLRETPISRFTAAGVHVGGRDIALDAIVFATGFDAVTGALSKIDIVGRSGQRLIDKWTNGPKAYLGLMTAGFPNLFMVNGPGSAAALSNALMSIEHHVDWIANAMARIAPSPEATMEATSEAEEGWMNTVEETAAGSIFARAPSWFNGANVEGKARAFLVFVGGVDRYQQLCNDVAGKGYPGFRLRNFGAEGATFPAELVRS